MFPQTGSDAARNGFASTQWSVVLAARDASSGRAHAALSTLCSTYWRPLYLFVRRSGHSIEDAQDLTQSFFARLLEKDSLRHVDPALGKFRAFLLASLKNFLTNEWRRTQTAKRGGDAQIVSLEAMTQAEDFIGNDSALTPEQLYQRNWALALLTRATSRLESEFAAAGKSHLFQTLKPYLTGDAQARYAEVAAALGMSEVTVRVSVHRMRGRFRDLLQQEVSQTLADPADPAAVAQELRFLLTVL
jgi:RNA polymerase sigma-70 factor (ECF subfamily)